MGNRKMPIEAYLDIADHYAAMFSGCTKVSVGAVIINTDGDILSLGANAAIPDLCKVKGCMRVEKYGDNAKAHRLPSDCRALHSEIDAICHLTQSAKGCTMCVTRYPCEACARAIVASGIKEVFYGRKEKISEETQRIFESGGVTVFHLSQWLREDNNA